MFFGGMMKKIVANLVAGTAVVGALGASPVLAQEDDSGEIETVVVTAQKRSENLQKVAATVSAVGAAQLERLQVNTATDLTQAVPGFTIYTSGGTTHAYIRGVGTATGTGQEPPVNVFIDGVYYQHPSISNALLNNLERVEVIKGPQGTLFGRNAVGGVISYVTKDPTQDAHVDAQVSYGNYDTVGANLYASVGVASNLAADIAIAVEDQREGWGTNLYTGNDLHESSRYAARTKWVLEPSDTLKFTLIADYSRAAAPTNGFVASRGVYSFINTGPFHNGDFYDAYLPVDPEHELTSRGTSLKMEVGFDWATFVSISALRRDSQVRNGPYEFSPPFLPLTPAVGQVPNNKIQSYQTDYNRSFTQEFQLLSAAESSVKWVAGAYLLYTDAGYGIRNNENTSGATGSVNTRSVTSQQTDSYSMFAQATVPVFERTRVTAGVRYTNDHRAVKGYATRNTVAAPDVYTLRPGTTERDNPQPSGTWSKFTYKAGVEHDVTDNIFGYASFSTGFQSAYYNIGSSAGNPPLQPVTVDAYEIGMKGDFLSNRLRVNTALFRYNLSNVVVDRLINAISSQANAAESKVQGIDLDITAVPVDKLTLTASASYTDPKYKDYQNSIHYVPNPNGINWSVVAADDSGQQLQATEKFAAAATANYRFDTGIGEFSLTGAINYRSGIHFDTQDLNTQPSYSLVNASFGWTAPGGKLEVTLWGKNLTDEEVGDLFPGDVLMQYCAEAPRTYGVRFGYHWD
jgi:iron complex outermembrane recepter protein